MDEVTKQLMDLNNRLLVISKEVGQSIKRIENLQREAEKIERSIDITLQLREFPPSKQE